MSTLIQTRVCDKILSTFRGMKTYILCSNIIHLSDVYGLTSSVECTMTLFFPEPVASETTISVTSSASAQGTIVLAPVSATSISISITLTAAHDNGVRISTSPLAAISSATLTPPTGLYYPATSFSLHGNANLTTCPAGTCAPVGSKIGNLSPNGSASITIQNPHKSAVSGPKYISFKQ